MPKVSARRMLARELEDILHLLIIDDKENTVEFSEIMDLYQGLCSTRILSDRSNIPKTTTAQYPYSPRILEDVGMKIIKEQR